MRKKYRILSILLALVMIISSSAMSSFALTGTGDQDQNQEETLTLTAPADFKALPSHQSVVLSWTAVPGAEEYIVFRDGTEYGKTAGTEFIDNDAKKDKTYNYKVRATAKNGTVVSPDTAESQAARVRTAYYICTFKANVKLKSHDKKKKAVTFKKGQQVRAEGYSTGSYKFTYNGRPYEAKWFRMKKVKVDYKKDAYTVETAESYINRGGYKSPTKYLIWINIYSQQVFVFEGSQGNWKCLFVESCNTGAGKSPTPTGFSKKIGKKYKKHSVHKYWSCFSSFNAIHGRNKKDPKPGKPISNGCVRISNAKAEWIMKNCPKKTKVISW